LRAFWADRLGYVRATSMLSISGRIVSAAVFLGGLALLVAKGRVYLPAFVVPPFTYAAAARETRDAAFSVWTELGRRRSSFLRTGYLDAHPVAAISTTPAIRALRAFAPGRFNVVLVIDRSMKPVGFLTEAALVEGLSRLGPTATVGDIIREEK